MRTDPVITYNHGLPGGAATIHCLEPGDDTTPVLDFIDANPILAVDTETTGLDPWATGFRDRLIQIGNAAEAWVLPVEADPALLALAQRAVLSAEHLVAHNASFDAVVLDATGIAPLELIYPKVVDTLTLSRLADPLGSSVRQGESGCPGTPSRTSPANTSPRRWTPSRPSRPSCNG